MVISIKREKRLFSTENMMITKVRAVRFTWFGGTALTGVSPGFSYASTAREPRAHNTLQLVMTHAIPDLGITRTKSVI